MAGNVSGTPAQRLNVLTLAYVASRALYNYVYVAAQDNARVAPVRPLVWLVGMGVIMTLFVGAAGKIN